MVETSDGPNELRQRYVYQAQKATSQPSCVTEDVALGKSLYKHSHCYFVSYGITHSEQQGEPPFGMEQFCLIQHKASSSFSHLNLPQSTLLLTSTLYFLTFHSSSVTSF